MLLEPFKARVPYISKAGSFPSTSMSGLRKHNSNYNIFVVCGTCNSSKTFSRKHNQYLCPFCDEGGAELLFPIQEEMEELEQKNLDLPDLGVRYSTTDGKTLDNPIITSSGARSFSGRGNARAVYPMNIDSGGSRTRHQNSDDFNRICELDDRQLAAKGGITITSDEIVREKSRNVLSPEELAALEKGDIGVTWRRSLRTW